MVIFSGVIVILLEPTVISTLFPAVILSVSPTLSVSLLPMLVDRLLLDRPRLVVFDGGFQILLRMHAHKFLARLVLEDELVVAAAARSTSST